MATKRVDPYIRTLTNIEKKVDKSLSKLRSDLAKKKDKKTLQKDYMDVILLLAECNYLTKECRRISKKEHLK